MPLACALFVYLMKQKQVKTTNKIRHRAIFVFSIFVLFLAALCVRLGWIQIYNADEYAQKALKQQTSDSVITAVRGDILDCNYKQLAVSSTSNTIWVRPSSVKRNGKSDAEIEGNARMEAASLAAILSMDEDTVYDTITAEKTLIKLKKYVDASTAEMVREGKFEGIEIVEDARRSYPLNTFASHILGFTNDDNDGQNGLELYYNRQLSGINGRYITKKDKNTSSLIYGTSKYYDPQDGYTLVTTIDEGIQYIVEQKLDEYREITGASRMMCIVMDPKTAGVIAMAQTNDYNPNDPRVPIDAQDIKLFETMTDAEKVNHWYKMWRSFCINDTYEPGSTFKLITTSIALDTGVTSLSRSYTCNASIQVADRLLKCWNYPRAHGTQSLKEAVAHSCNTTMVKLIQNIGLKAYYEGLDSFGLTAKTGIDYPGEGSNIIYSSGDVGPVELATMSYGQGISVTPISLITAVSSLANGGYVMQPHFMKEVLDSEGNVVESFEPTVKGVSVSAQTAEEILSIMQYVVDSGGAGNTKIAGYKIGGKTGTASKPTVGGYSETDYFSSFIGVCPVDDPKFVLLVLTDTPKGKIYGSQVAAPCARAIIEEALQYYNIQPQYTAEELKQIESKKTTVPDVSGEDLDHAIGKLGTKNLEYELSPALNNLTEGEILITDQFPKAGEEVAKKTKVTLYYEIVAGETWEDIDEAI